MKPVPVLHALLLAGLAVSTAAQTAPTAGSPARPAAPPATTAATKGTPAAPAPGQVAGTQPRLRNITGSFAAVVTGNMPADLKAEPAPAPATAAPAEEAIAPNNAQITRLNPVTVFGERPLIFKEREIYSESELKKIALQKYRGLRLLPIGFLNDLNKSVAETMYFEEQRASDIQSLNESAAAAARGGDLASARAIQAQTVGAFARPGEAWKNPTRESASPTWTNEIKKVGALR